MLQSTFSSNKKNFMFWFCFIVLSKSLPAAFHSLAVLIEWIFIDCPISKIRYVKQFCIGLFKELVVLSV